MHIGTVSGGLGEPRWGSPKSEGDSRASRDTLICFRAYLGLSRKTAKRAHENDTQNGSHIKAANPLCNAYRETCALSKRHAERQSNNSQMTVKQPTINPLSLYNKKDNNTKNTNNARAREGAGAIKLCFIRFGIKPETGLTLRKIRAII